MKHYLSGLINPYLLPLWVTLLIIFIFPLQIDKYKAILIEKGDRVKSYQVRFDDLDNDAVSERIEYFHNSLGVAGLTVSNSHGVLDQYTFHGRYDFVQQAGTIITGDRDGNGIKEIYVFTLSNDSILLHCIADYKKGLVSVQNKFIAITESRNKTSDPYIIRAEMDDLNNDRSSELIFGIGTGYSLTPRRVFAYDFIRDTVLMSPESGYFLKGIIQKDLDGDGYREIIPYGYAASNVHDTLMPYPDWCSWLMVLNRNLQFEYEPVPFEGQFSSLTPVVLNNLSGKSLLVALYQPPDHQGDSSVLLAFDNQGNIVKKILVPFSASNIFSLEHEKGRDDILLCRDKEGFDLYDASFKLKKTIQTNSTFDTRLIDIDLDGFDEIVVSDIYQGKLTVYRNELKHPVEMELKSEGETVNISIIKKPGVKSSDIYYQSGTRYYQYHYDKNPWYNFRFIIYLAIYISILAFTLLVRKIQLDQLRRKLESEKKITDLQLQIIRNQIDPHFVMNATNSIIASITENDKQEAKQQLLHFSRLHRSLLLSSDKIQRSLKEEIDFTENYLALEKFRFRDKFTSTLSIAPGVNLMMPVPKMIVQIHVENALKHGILPLEKNGYLTIQIFPEHEFVVIEITDNGVGRAIAQVSQDGSTGRGIDVMDQYAVLFNRYHPGKIKSEIEDLYDETGKPKGTKVKIAISEAYER
jgi:hypothetical protein